MKQFPDNFTWGAATSCYQIEGGWLEGGKGPSVWDGYAHTPGKTRNGETGDVAADHYHRWREDVALMADIGLKAYRFSISWPRIQPTGRGEANREGIKFYSDLVDALLEHDITPWATLHHWDMPLALQMECDGWLNPDSAKYFAEYAAICFEHLGDRVKHWITINEPWCTAIFGFGQGVFAPGRASNVELYLAAHNLLRAHAYSADAYRTKFQDSQKGVIGIANNCDWREPKTGAPQDKAAAQRALEFFLGWFADPLYFGDYPEVMREYVGDRLPHFTDEDRDKIKGSTDYFGLNHYTTLYAEHEDNAERFNELRAENNGGMLDDQCVNLSADPSWPTTDMGWAITPWGCRKLLEWVYERYNQPEIYLTENGCASPDEVINGEVNDQPRIDFLNGYIIECRAAIENGVNLKGYFVWSLMDNFEWALGYSKRFGMVHIDYKTLKRTPKNSAAWYRKVIQQNGI